MPTNELPPMMCTQCTKPIVAESGYFTSWVAWKRMDFHIQCRPHLTFSKERREDTIPKAPKAG